MAFIRSALKKLVIKMVVENKKINSLLLYMLAEKEVFFFRKMDDHVMIYYPHDIIGLMLTDRGEYSRKAVYDISNLFSQHAISLDGRCILELGGNIGTHTIYFCREFEYANVVSVEPDPENIFILKQNIKLNGVEDRVRTVHGAVSNRDGELELVRDFFNRGGASVSLHNSRQMPRASTFSVNTVTVDSLLKSLDLDSAKIGLVWIDVEGHELEVLEGMERLIAYSKPPIFFEYTPGETSRNDRIASLLFGAYRQILVHRNGFQKIDRDSFDKIADSVDLLAIDLVFDN